VPIFQFRGQRSGKDFGYAVQRASMYSSADGCILCRHWADVFLCYTLYMVKISFFTVNLPTVVFILYVSLT